MLLIIAPSKTQSSASVTLAETTQPQFLKDSETLMAELGKLSVRELAALMKMSDRLAEQTHARINTFHTPFTAENSSPALFSFQGDVYSRIDCESYKKQELDYVQEHLLILSGLYGMLRPFDLMQPYRLEMGCRFAGSWGKNLYDFWANRITGAVNKRLTAMEEPTVVNLASKEYSRVIKEKQLLGNMLQIDCWERKGDGYKTVAIHAKRARGLLVDFAVKNRLQKVEGFKEFSRDGYCFREEFSKADHFVFTRD